MSVLALPAPSYDHIRRLTDETGIIEHADGLVPRRESGYCTDDNARALILMTRDSSHRMLRHFGEAYLAFIRHAHRGSGLFFSRMTYSRQWNFDEVSDDASGRAIQALGASALRHPMPALRAASLDHFEQASPFDSPHIRSMAYAGLGATEVLRADPSNRAALQLANRVRERLDVPAPTNEWPWLEARLQYDNALLAEAMMACGAAVGQQAVTERGLGLLRWLVELQTCDDGHLSVVPVTGWAPGDEGPGFDQQPIEVGGLASAAFRAFQLTHDEAWLGVILQSAQWFAGFNDASVAVFDPAHGGGADGLTPSGRSANCGAESTLAAVQTLRLAQICAHPEVADELDRRVFEEANVFHTQRMEQRA